MVCRLSVLGLIGKSRNRAAARSLAALLLLCSCAGDTTRWAQPPMHQEPPQGQRVIERTDKDTGIVLRRWTIRYASDGRAFRDGPEWLYWPDGTMRAERNWVDGEPAGRWRSFHSSGSLQMRLTHGPEPSNMAFFFDDGTVSAQGLALRGVKQGEWAHFHPDGSLSHLGFYERGMKQGAWTHHYPGGALARRGNYLDGRMDGTWQRWKPEPPIWTSAWWPAESEPARGVPKESN